MMMKPAIIKDDHTRAVLQRTAQNIGIYVILTCVAIITVFPFLWVFFTSFKGPTDAVYSVPPQLIPKEPTLENYIRVWNFLPVGRFFINSITVTIGVVAFNTLFTSLAAYPLAKMKFKGRDTI